MSGPNPESVVWDEPKPDPAKVVWANQSGQALERSGPVIDTDALAATIKDVPRLAGQGAAQTVQGIMDIPVGAAQLASKVIPGDSVENAVAAYMRARDKSYAPYTGADERPGDVQPGRVAGNVITGIGMSPSTVPQGLGGRMVAGAKTGGLMGLLAPVDPDNPNFWTTKTAGTTLSAGAGFVMPAVVEGLTRGATTVVNKLANFFKGQASSIAGNARPAVIESELQLEFNRNGVEWAKLPQQMRDQLVGEVQSALKSGGKLDPAAISRMADFTKVGVHPTQGQVTRDPYQWGNERNLSRTDPGRPLAERLTQQNSRMIEVLDTPRANLQAAPDAYGTGTRAAQALRSADAGTKAQVDLAYGQARDHLGRAAPMDSKAFADQANLALDEGQLGHYLPAEVRGILNDVSSGKTPFNVNTATQIDSVLSAAQRKAGAGTPEALAIGKVRDALNAAPIGDNVGEAAKAAFDAARAQAASRFATLRATPAMDAAVDRGVAVTPEKFIEEQFVRGTVDGVSSAMRQIPADGRANVQAGVLDWIRSKAVLGEGDTGTISAAGIKRAIDTIGEPKLRAIFGDNPELLSQLDALKRVAAYIDRPPKSSSFNPSGTGPAMLDSLLKVQKLPIIGALIGQPGDFIRATQVARSMNAVAPVQPAPPMIPQGSVDRVAPRLGLLGPAAAAPFVPRFFRNPVDGQNERRQ